MAQHYKKVTQIKLKTGGTLQIELSEGDRVRQAKARGSGVVYLKNYNNRMIDVTMIGEIEDITVEDHQQIIINTPENRRLSEAVPKPATDTSPGYLKFLEAKKNLLEKMSRRNRR